MLILIGYRFSTFQNNFMDQSMITNPFKANHAFYFASDETRNFIKRTQCRYCSKSF